ncbi:glycosyltransferase family 39 protein [Candidatus Sumerlaeota bacterium]|nr:glycosyltransferase family 39 protein [Candidatus Sumerlaeota bacterium]
MKSENEISTLPAIPEGKKPEISTHFLKIFLSVLSFLYAFLVTASFGLDYIDFGDGNYLYISSRLADGLVLYRDIMAPQPPCHLYLGSLLIRLGRIIGNPLYTVRSFSLILHLATVYVVSSLAWKIFHREFERFAAPILYLLIPIGFWWSQGYQSEGLLIFFLLVSFYFYIDFNPRSMIIASVFGVLAVFTNMTAAPYALFSALYLAIRQTRRSLYYIVPLAVLGLLGIGLMEIVTDGSYLNNVFFNQVGTFPNPKITGGEGPVQYAFRKIMNEGKDVLAWEGGYVLFGFVGLVFYLLKGKEGGLRREYVGWYSFFSLCSIIYVSKGGTMEYIFTIGEPFVVLFFAHAMAEFWRNVLLSGGIFSRFDWKDTSRIAAFCSFIFLLAATFYIGLFYIRNTLLGYNYELSGDKIKQVKEIIETHSHPGDAILSPPYYAFISGRRVIEEYSENYIWTIKYAHETMVERKPGEGVKKALAIARALEEKKIPIVLLDLAQTGNLPPIKKAIEQNYRPLPVWNGSHILQTLNPQIGFYIPK